MKENSVALNTETLPYLAFRDAQDVICTPQTYPLS